MVEWEEIKIEESDEPLVDIKKLCRDLVIRIARRKLKNEKSAYLRKTVAGMLCQAKDYLPKGMTFIIGDAWRPKKVQEEIQNNFRQLFKKIHPEWSKEKIEQELPNYAAPTSGATASGHLTGGAIDLRLWKNGRKVPMKSKKLSYEENAKSDQPKLPKQIQKNRQIMFDALTKAGLSNYPLEYWYWSYGDNQWAKRNNKKIAIYGVIEK